MQEKQKEKDAVMDDQLIRALADVLGYLQAAG